MMCRCPCLSGESWLFESRKERVFALLTSATRSSTSSLLLSQCCVDSRPGERVVHGSIQKFR